MTSNLTQSVRKTDIGRAGPEHTAALLDVQSVAELLGCSPRHVYRLADRGAMPRPLGLGRLRRWSRAAISEWIDAGCPSLHRAGKRATR